jgi:Matrixin
MRTRTVIVLAGAALAAALCGAAVPQAFAYCLTGVRWPDGDRPADVFYNTKGKVTSGQCISSAQMDSAVTGSVSPWKAIRYAGTTSKGANKRDGQNTIGWAKLGGGTLGITNYLSYDRTRTASCKGNLFANLYEADVRLTTSYRWTSPSGSCPCAAGSAYYVDGVATHELGHVIGLCHTTDPSDLMYPSFGACEDKNKSSDETAGENALCY